jgi:hypothetical protein
MQSFHFFHVVLAILFRPKLHRSSFSAMPTLITFVIQDEEPTMAPPIPTSNTIPISAPKMKNSVQLTLDGDIAVPVSKSFPVASFRKKNGTNCFLHLQNHVHFHLFDVESLENTSALPDCRLLHLEQSAELNQVQMMQQVEKVLPQVQTGKPVPWNT